jgi:hypothetical protein
MSLRVWLNRTYATNYHFVGMVKNNPDGHGVHVIATHVDENSPVLVAADTAVVEPEGLADDAYVQWALDFATQHAVEVFWPTAYREAIAANAVRFEQAGVKVVVSALDAFEVFEDKGATYALADSLGVSVPPYAVVDTADAFDEAYYRFVEDGHQVCFKPVRGVGGQGFRIINGSPAHHWEPFIDMDELLIPDSGFEVPLMRVLETLRLAEKGTEPIPALMVMPVLAGGEVSVDLLTNKGEVLCAVPRFKRSKGRAVELREAPELVAEAALLMEATGLSYLSNVQFRFDTEGRHYLLEVNPRPSGGLFQSCLSGVNLPWYTLRLALDGTVDVPAPVLPQRLVTLPTAVALP